MREDRTGQSSHGGHTEDFLRVACLGVTLSPPHRHVNRTCSIIRHFFFLPKKIRKKRARDEMDRKVGVIIEKEFFGRRILVMAQLE